MKVSIIIPTYNEEGYIGSLLERISQQTIQPYEVIIADNYSEDDTFGDIAQYTGRLNVIGVDVPRLGGVGRSRNIGAALATGDVLLFLDADVEPEPHFLEQALAEFTARKLDFANVRFNIDANQPKLDHLGAKAVNTYFASFQFSRNPVGHGFCIFANRTWHKRIGGFNEDFRHSEDHDYIRRAVEQGASFRFLKSVQMKLSLRRYDYDGRLTMFKVFTKTEVNRLFFNYKYAPRDQALYSFGIFTKKNKRRTTQASSG